MNQNMIWEYWVIEKKDVFGESSFGIHELYFAPSNNNGKCECLGYTVNPLFGSFPDAVELKDFLEQALNEGENNLPGDQEDINRWLKATEKNVIAFNQLPPGNEGVSSPNGDPSHPYAMKVVIVKR